MTPIAHVGISVPDVEQALRWYARVLGLDPLGPTVEVRAGDGHAGRVASDVFGPGFGRFRQAHLTSANGVAIELFEFVDPPGERHGIFHLCVVAPDVDGVAERIAAGGGRRTSRTWEIFPGEPYRTCYTKDPFGNTVELYSHSHERIWSNRGVAG
jgi:catechol 2,3-dioxygenase-like lactoylglutathione lyase family enzyme